MVTELLQGRVATNDTKAEVAGFLPSTAHVVAHTRNDYAVNAEVVEEHEPQTKAEVQKEMILRALRHNNGRRREAAAELFMSERTLYRKIKELGIEEKDL
jgi:DNA-binding NtrC family response regulator